MLGRSGANLNGIRRHSWNTKVIIVENHIPVSVPTGIGYTEYRILISTSCTMCLDKILYNKVNDETDVNQIHV